MQVDLSGQNILLTGASRGIGAALAQQLMQSGARLVLHYHKEAERAKALAAEANNGSLPIQADLSDPQACRQLWEQSVDALGEIHALVNNAGVSLHVPIEEDEDTWLAKWNLTLQVNLTAAALLSRHAVRHFAGKEGGRLVFIASRAAFRGDTPDYLAYAASKGGMASLARSIARGFGKKNIKSFLINPGFVRTDMAAAILDRYGEEYALNDIALPQLTETKDLAPLVALLCSGLADHATGSCIDVNAGSYVR